MISVKGIGSLSTKNNFVLLIRDTEIVGGALREALADASPEERPGLERAIALAESVAAATDTELRARWVRARLANAGFTGDVSSVAAVKALRQAERGLSLTAAVELQKAAVAHPELPADMAEDTAAFLRRAGVARRVDAGRRRTRLLPRAVRARHTGRSGPLAGGGGQDRVAHGPAGTAGPGQPAGPRTPRAGHGRDNDAATARAGGRGCRRRHGLTGRAQPPADASRMAFAVAVAS